MVIEAGFGTGLLLHGLPDATGHAPAHQLPALAHAAGFGIALLPAETLGALGITLAQFFAGIRLVFVLIALGVVDEAQLQGIDRQGASQFIHGTLQADQPQRRSRGAHVQGREHIQRQ
ncbi:hypothetical protein D3C87_1290660 [compost metagenome]